MTNRLRIFVSGMIAGDPQQGGATWAVLQYVLGLRQAGHDVYFVEPITLASIRPAGAPLLSSANARYFRNVTTTFDLTERAAILLSGTRDTFGIAYGALLDAAKTCDLLINISGMLTDPQLLEVIPRRVYLDLDPAFNQLWHATQGVDMRFDSHTHFVTVGLTVGTSNCGVPACGRTWLTTLQPVVLSEWPLRENDPGAAWTTVGHWRGYGSIEHDGVFYGQKAHSFRRLIDLPRRTRARLQPALAIHPGETRDLEALRANGWDLLDPAAVAGATDDYRRFIQGSKAELGIAKSGYVESRCGWFSDRSACYLATGRPVVAQETGFSRVLPAGEGLLAFGTVDELAADIERVEAAYPRHCQWARDLAEEYFRADLVLGRLLETVGRTPIAGSPGLGPDTLAVSSHQ